MTIDSNIIAGFIGGIIGSCTSLIFHIIRRCVNNYLTSKREVNLLLGELDDIMRHCRANVEILNNIDLSQGIPSKLHIKKMIVAYYSIFCSLDTFRSINSKHSQIIHDLKLIIRNIDIDINTVIEYLDNPDYNILTMDNYVKYLKDKFLYVEEKIAYIHRKMQISKFEIYKGKPRSKKILYEKRFVAKRDIVY